MGSRFRASWVFAGVAAAFAMHVTVAVLLGQLLTLAPRRVVEAVVGVLFLLGALLLLRESRQREEEDESTEAELAASDAQRAPTFLRVAGAAFGVIAVAEFGDLTQILTANLAAKYDDPLSVGIGSTLALWSVGGLAIVGGRELLRVVPIGLMTRIAALVMAGLAVYSFVSAVRG